MTEGLPFAHSYNLARLANAGDEVRFATSDEERAAIAKWAGLLSLEKLETRVEIRKLALNHFGLSFQLSADVTQSCVVTLEPVVGHIEHSFRRELVFVGPSRHKQPPDSVADLVVDTTEEDGPEEIQSLHVDLAAPVLEEFALSLDPYPRRPGVEFTPETGASDQPESPFAILKDLK